jgi:hypothetical protein
MLRAFLLTGASLISAPAFSQYIISGTVTDAQHQPLTGTVVKNKATGTSADNSGNFKITVASLSVKLELLPQSSPLAVL